jgi:hypothetical protein
MFFDKAKPSQDPDWGPGHGHGLSCLVQCLLRVLLLSNTVTLALGQRPRRSKRRHGVSTGPGERKYWKERRPLLPVVGTHAAPWSPPNTFSSSSAVMRAAIPPTRPYSFPFAWSSVAMVCDIERKVSTTRLGCDAAMARSVRSHHELYVQLLLARNSIRRLYVRVFHCG